MDWTGSAFVATPGDVPVADVPSYVGRVFVQVAFGMTPRVIEPSRLALLRSRFEVCAWAWCTGEDVEGEARFHAHLVHEGGYPAFVANMEEPYDAHGHSGSARFDMPSAYLDALLSEGFEGPLGVTTTPLFGSHMGAWQAVDAVYLPQSFPTAAEGGKAITTVVDHGEDWGWERDRIRPLVQTYAGPTGRPNAPFQNAEATALGVGVVPYTLEQAVEETPSGVGFPSLDVLRQSIERPTPSWPNGDFMALIGTQHGITAMTSHWRTVWPNKTNPNRDPDNLSTWGAIDKLERTLLLLVADHDEREAE